MQLKNAPGCVFLNFFNIILKSKQMILPDFQEIQFGQVHRSF